MIVTVTANPGLDKTVGLAAPLVRGGFQRVTDIAYQASGKGVNVSLDLRRAGEEVVTVLPCGPDDPYLERFADHGLEVVRVPIAGRIRENLTVTEPGGVTTKINEPGPVLSSDEVGALTTAVLRASRPASWVLLSGSLPGGVPPTWYATLTSALRQLDCYVGVDTSDEPLLAVVGAPRESAPHLLKPNSDELATLTGLPAAALESDPDAAATAALSLVADGIDNVLVTLGAAGAVLGTARGAWVATSPGVEVRSTVGAGDAALVGWLLAHLAGATDPEALRNAVAYGAAAVATPGTGWPTPAEVEPFLTEVRLREAVTAN